MDFNFDSLPNENFPIVTISYIGKRGDVYKKLSIDKYNGCTDEESTVTELEGTKTLIITKTYENGRGYNDYVIYDNKNRVVLKLDTVFLTVGANAISRNIFYKKYVYFRHLKFIDNARFSKHQEPVTEQVCQRDGKTFHVIINGNHYKHIHSNDDYILMYCEKNKEYLFGNVDNEGYYFRAIFKNRFDMINHLKITNFNRGYEVKRLSFYNAILNHQPNYIKEAMLSIQ